MTKRILLPVATLALCSVSLAQEPLPKPYKTPSINNAAKVISKPEGASLKLPAGFKVEEFATGFARPRFLLEGRAGEILVSDTIANGFVYLVKDGEKKPLLSGLDRPYGLAWWKDYLYVGEPTSIKRYKYDAKAMTAGKGEEVVSYPGYTKGHVTRTIAFNKAGDKMFIAVGSSGDLVVGDPTDRAVINMYNPDGTGHEVYAGGLRNPVGLRMYPGTDQLWVTVEERNELGDGLVADFFSSVKKGGFYGWPYAYLGPHEDPRIKDAEKRPDLVAKTIAPEVPLEPHCAILDFVFYTGKQFPAEYRNGAFLANHGSSNRADRVGYSLSFVPFKHGKPAGPTRDFLTGFNLGADKKEVWGRPVGLLQLKDGGLLMSDDGGKVVWHISYAK